MTKKLRKAPPAHHPEPTEFLNVDLELEGPAAPMAVLGHELAARLFHLHAETRRGRTRHHYEAHDVHRAGVERTLEVLVKALGKLSAPGKKAWTRLKVRDFNVGIQAGQEPHLAEYEVGPKTLTAIAALGGRLVWTVYAPFPRPKR